MAVTEEFEQAVSAKNIRLVRIMLKNSLVGDPTFLEFQQMIDRIGERLPELFDKHDGKDLNQETSAWTKNYLDEQMVQIVYNFSEERLELLKNICRYLYADKARKIKLDRKETPMTKGSITQKQMATGIVVAGVVVVVAGVASSQVVLAGAGVVVIGVGGALIFKEMNKK